MSQKLEKNKFIVNVSDNKENYSQKNNQYTHANSKGVLDVKAATMCNFTSVCMALDYNGHQFPDLGKWTQPEDALADFTMTSKEVDDFYAKYAPALYKDYKKEVLDSKGKPAYYTPNEVHKVLEFATNLWLKDDIDNFRENVDIFDILKELINGRACVISGVFNGLHHIVTLVGAEWNFVSSASIYNIVNSIFQTHKLPDTFIIDDPYGDFRKQYQNGFSGNDIRLSTKEFLSMIKPVGNEVVKMAHFIKSGPAIV